MSIENKQKYVKCISFVLIVILLLSLKFFHKKLNANSFNWLLAPTTFLVEIFTGHKFIYDSEIGYVSINERIIINKSCAGINLFILLSFLSIYVLLNEKIKTSNQLIRIIPYLIFACFFTIFTNAIRISFSILFEPIRLNSSILLSVNNWIHQGIGTFIFLISFLTFYFLLLRGKLWMKKIFG